MSLYNKYVQQEANTNHPIKNTIMIYERCISRFRAVERAIDNLKFKEADEHLDILEFAFHELTMQVNEKANEGLAEDLYRLYNWILSEIEQIKRFRKTSNIKGIEEVLMDLIEGFSSILKNSEI